MSPCARARVPLALLLLLLLLLALPATLGGASCAPRPARLVLLCASSLGPLAQELADEFGRRAGCEVQLRLAASSTLARQLQQGLQADVFLSASPEWAEAVGALERRPWLGNRLAWAVRRDGPRPAPGAATSLVLGERAAPVGRYAEQQLALAGHALPARVVRAANARDTVRKLREGAAEAALVYVTDLREEPSLEALALLPPDGPPPARYVVALLREPGRALADALFEPAALQRALELGFEPPP